MDCSSVSRLKGGGTGSRSCWKIIKDTHMQIGMLIVEHIRVFVMGMMGEEVLHWIHERVMERIVTLKESSK